MKQGILAIYDKDTAYACRLMEYLNQDTAFFLEVRVFTNLLSLQDYLEDTLIEILLVGEQIELDQIDKEHIHHIMLLTEHGVVREGSEYPGLYKYQSMEGLVKEIAVCYAGTAEKLVQSFAEVEHSKNLIGVFSPYGGCGKTLFSMALGQALADGARVLYIGMEMVSSFKGEENIRGNLSDILYWVRERKEECLSALSLMTEKRGRLDCIFSPDHYGDLVDVTEEDMEFFIRELYRSSPYEIIIFDIGGWNHAMFYLLEKMDEIYMPDFLNRTHLKKEEGLLNSMCLTGKGSLYKKIKKVELPFDEVIYQGNYDLNKINKTKMGQYVCRLIKKNSI